MAGQPRAEAVEVDAQSAHRAVWRVYGAGKAGGTAFAITERHFLTCAHVIKYLSGHGAKEVVLDRHGSSDRRSLRVNWGHVALTLVQDIALFTTKETVDHHFDLAPANAIEGETGLRTMGHPGGLALETLRQTDPVTYQNDFHLEDPADRITRGGLSGSPVFPGRRQGGGDALPGQRQHRRCGPGQASSPLPRRRPAVDRLQRTIRRWRPCIERATTQTRELAEAGNLVAQYQLGARQRSPGQGPWPCCGGPQGVDLRRHRKPWADG